MVDQVTKMLEFVARCDVPDKLRQVAKNAEKHGESALAMAARLRLYEVLPAEKPGTIEHAVWQSIYALEDVLKQERGKTILLSRTRQKIARHGEVKCVDDLVCGPPSDGFQMLLDRNMLDLSFEAVALKFQDKFCQASLDAARRRLQAVGYDA
jgi:hypothetical protein